MELPGNTILWAFTVLILIATISIPFLAQIFREGGIPETATTKVRIPKAQISAQNKAVAYRLRGVPSKLEEQDVRELVKKALVLENDIIVHINSLADDPSRHGEKIATLEFSKTPRSLSKETGNAEWKFSVHDSQWNDRGKISLLFDTHFRGLTSLHTSSDAECTIDLIAVSGLGSHAFGSFKERNGSHMWLRDSLAHDIPNMRILIYGYDTQMYGSTSFANLDDLANEFQERIRSIRSYPRLRRSEIPTTNPERPLILIGHSLGGIIIKAALIRMYDGDDSDKANFKSVCGMLFFGVPNQGMPISQWIPIVEDQSNRFFIEQLCTASDILRAFRNDFRKIFTFRDSKIYSFYETRESPTAQEVIEGKWELTGPCIALVNTASATHGRAWEEGGSYIKPIHRTHSDLVKFSPIDDDYTTVSNCLLEFADTACATIMKRFGSAQKILRLPIDIDIVSEDQILHILQSVNQDQFKSTIPTLDCDNLAFCWIFKNMDFQHWKTADRSQILCLYGPPECNLRCVSSYVVNENLSNKPRTVLYYFCSSEETEVVAHFVRALLYQFVRYSPENKQKSIFKNFFQNFAKSIEREEETDKTFKGSSEKWLNNIHNAPNQALWNPLMGILAAEPDRELLIVIDGLDEVRDLEGQFVRSIREFIDYLQQRLLNMKVLLTSQPQANIKTILNGLPYIEHDKERRECRASLYFENPRYRKISKEHEGSLEWIWSHDQYKEWSRPDASRFLYLQGKPGSGKSTLTKYFRENISKRDPDSKSAIMAKFFYSDRDGELQKSHYNMLRYILYEILSHHEAYFYRSFQSEYRKLRLLQDRDYSGPVKWDYESLKRVLSSLSDFSPAKRLYLIIDAVDESDEDDRREILNLMFNLCSESKDCVVKIFLASRPIGVLQKYHASKFSDSKFLSIKLQDQTKSDIARFADSFLKDLEFSSFLKLATEYIVKNAHGVFLWVQLVKKELLAYDEAGRCSEKDIFEFLKSLPTELEELYKRMLNKMGQNEADIWDGIRMFQLVLFGCRPLTANELLHALAIPGKRIAESTISNDSFRNSIPPERRIFHCGGNFLEIRRSLGNIIYEDSTTSQASTLEVAGHRSVQVMHQTVREFFLRPSSAVAASDFKMSEKDAHICISITCIRYLILCEANLAERLPDAEYWTPRHFKDCAQYLHEMPFMAYALSYLSYHIDGSQNDADVMSVVSDLIDQLMNSPTGSFLEDWITSRLNIRLFENKRPEMGLGNRILYAALTEGYPTAAEISLIAGADANERDEAKTSLHRAAENGYEAVVELLLRRGADLMSTDSFGRTPLLCAAKNRHKTVVELLLKFGANQDSQDIDGRTSLSWAAENGHETMVKLLLGFGANPDSEDAGGRTSLSWAAENGHETVVRLLLDKGADLNSRDNYGRTSLVWAAENGHETMIKLLLDKGTDPNPEDYYSRTLLSWAEENGQKTVVRLLLGNGTSVEPEDQLNRTALR